jgi:hypothetical protein
MTAGFCAAKTNPTKIAKAAAIRATIIFTSNSLELVFYWMGAGIRIDFFT